MVTGTVASGAVGTTQSASDNSTKIATTAYADRAATVATAAEIRTGTNATHFAVPANMLTALGFTNYFQSSQQSVIDSVTQLTLAHGLGRQPVLYQAYLINQSAEHGYTSGQEVPIAWNQSQGAGANPGITCVPDATNLVINFGNTGNRFIVIDRNTSNYAFLDSNGGKWKMIVRAWG
jgi:hypothetical protein